jgi:hypothetical protein
MTIVQSIAIRDRLHESQILQQTPPRSCSYSEAIPIVPVEINVYVGIYLT